jgi:hypothetical protein
MNDFAVKTIRVKKLQRLLENGIFAVPSLQREFVWNGNKAAKLLDSVCRGMPIGALLVWKTDRRNQQYLRNHLHILPPFDSRINKQIWFLIDGQQRLSVLYQAHKGETKENSSGRQVDFSRLVFDLSTSRRSTDRFRYRRPEADLFSVGELLGPRWNRLKETLANYKRRRLEEVRTRLREYEVPVVFVETRDIGEIRELFIRINSQGTPVGAADRAFARATRLDLRAWSRDTLQKMPPDFGRLPYETILQAFAFVADDDLKDVGERAYDAFLRRLEREVARGERSKAEVQRQWHRFEIAFTKTVDYLSSHFCVVNNRFLPSTVMLGILAVFFANHRGQPDAKQREQIRRWFWATAVGQRYSGRGFRRNVLPDVKFFRNVANHRRPGLTTLERVEPLDLQRTDYARATSVAAAVYCLLGMRKPRYLSNGEPVPESIYSARANKKNRHHIFPRDLLKRNGFRPSEANSICNICFVVAEENQIIGSKKPSKYLEPFRRKRYFRSVLKSHLIPNSPALQSAAIRRAYRAFIKERRHLLCTALNREAGMKLFSKAT